MAHIQALATARSCQRLAKAGAFTAMCCLILSGSLQCSAHSHLYGENKHQNGALYKGLPATDCAPHFIPRQWMVANRHQVPGGKVLFGTYHAQQELWKHQNPVSCSNDTKFMVLRMVGDARNGIGSTIHVIGQYMAVALHYKRVFILDVSGTSWLWGSFCKGMRALDECYFEPMSSCTLNDATRAQEQHGGNTTIFVSWQDWGMLGWDGLNVPEVFRGMLTDAGIPQKRWYYWWRAQAAAYLVRPNARTLLALRNRRAAIYPQHNPPPGCIAVHIRRGDKPNESPNMIMSDEPFFKGAAGMYANRSLTGAPLSANIYLSTEDSKTAEFFQRQPGFAVSFTNVSRFHEKRSPVTHAAMIGHDIEFLNSLVSLELSLECSGFVVAMISNWARLIDELRATVACKAHLPLFDPEQPGGIIDFGW